MLANPVVRSQKVIAEIIPRATAEARIETTSSANPFKLTTDEASAMFVIGLCIFMALGSLVACTSLMVCRTDCGKTGDSTPQSSVPNAHFNNARVHENVQPTPGHQRHGTVDVDAEEPGHSFSSFRGMSMPPMAPPMSLATPEPFRHLTVQTSWGPDDDMPTKARHRPSNTMPVDHRHKPSKLVPSDGRRRPSNTMPTEPQLDPADRGFFGQHDRQRLPDNGPGPVLLEVPRRMTDQLRALPSVQPRRTRHSMTSIPTELMDPNFDYGDTGNNNYQQ